MPEFGELSRRRGSRRFLRIASVAILVGFLAACGGPTGNGSGDKLTIRVGGVTHAQSYMWAALAAKIYNAAYPGSTIQVTGFASGPPIMSGMATGQLDGSVGTGELPFINSVVGGSKMKLVLTNGWAQKAYAFAVLANSPIHDVADLKRKTVGIQLGTSLEEFAAGILKAKASLSLKDISVVNLQPNDAAVALTSKRIDAAVLDSGPLNILLGQGKIRVLSDATGTDWAAVDITALTDSFIAQQPTAARRFVEAVVLAERFAHDHAVMAAEFYQKQPSINIDFDAALLLVTVFPTYPVITDPRTVAAVQRVADYALSKGTLKSRLVIASGGDVNTSIYSDAEKRLGAWPYAIDSEMVVNMAERGQNTDSVLKTYVEELRKADAA